MADRCCLCPAHFTSPVQGKSRTRRRNLSVILADETHRITTLLQTVWPNLLASLASESKNHFACKSCFQTLETAGNRFNSLMSTLSSLRDSATATGLYHSTSLQLNLLDFKSQQQSVVQCEFLSCIYIR